MAKDSGGLTSGGIYSIRFAYKVFGESSVLAINTVLVDVAFFPTKMLVQAMPEGGSKVTKIAANSTRLLCRIQLIITLFRGSNLIKGDF